MVYVQLDKSNREEKKFKAVFYDDNRKKILTTHFGAKGYQDYTMHYDDERKRLYLERHSKENWNDPFSAGSLSRWLLWNKKSISASYNDYIKKFNFKKY
jgi:hypothetical protein